MGRIIRLTERDLKRLVKRVINEQIFFGNSGGLTLGTPEVDNGTVDLRVGSSNPCLGYKSSAELTLELFGKLRGVGLTITKTEEKNNTGQYQTIQSWISRLNNSMTGAGASNDLTKVLSEIKTQQQMGSVLNAYNKKFGRTLYQDLSGEYTISWDTIWGIVKKFKSGSGISIDRCKRYETQSA
jgi:hypothetical protein